jgi:ABC-type uncharacterized transport system permease subunit
MKKIRFLSEAFFVSAVVLTILTIGKILIDRTRVPYGINPIMVNREMLWGIVLVGMMSLLFTGIEIIVEKWKAKGSAEK